jgi:hypothetical protein
MEEAALILDAAASVIISKRGMAKELFGDAKATMSKLVGELKEM